MDGLGTAAQFQKPVGITAGQHDTIYLSDSYNNKIKIIDSTGLVSTYAGTGSYGYLDGPRNSALFRNAFNIKFDQNNNLVIADNSNNMIRKIDQATGEVSTMAGSLPSGNRDGQSTAAILNQPWAIATHSDGRIFFSDSVNGAIRVINTTGYVLTFATGLG